jgi:hypothetical protein
VADVPIQLGPNTLTVVATDGLGNTKTKTTRVYLDLPANKKTSRFSIQVAGTIADATATLSVNDVPATTANGQFTAQVPLVNGLNTLTTVARDPVGNTRTSSLRVFVPPPTSLPPKPTVGTIGDPIPTLTTASSITIGGTKTAGTSIWINGVQVYALDEATTWTAAIALVEGDNVLNIVARDAIGASSTTTTVNVIVDNLPPVITVNRPLNNRTNLNPYPLTGTVDDSQTTVTVNGAAAARQARSFEASLPLGSGATPVTIVATSPNGYTATTALTITLGTVPNLLTVQPADGTKRYVGSATTIQGTATDQEGDALEWQMLLDGVPFSDWQTANNVTWTPAGTASGLHTVEIRVRDGYGDYDNQTNDIVILRAPVQHP